MPLWNFGDPAASEQRFKAALSTASGDDALILQTQIARTHGLRNDFETARRILREIEPRIATAGAEVRIRHALETGRTYASAVHPPEALDRRREGNVRATRSWPLTRSRRSRIRTAWRSMRCT